VDFKIRFSKTALASFDEIFDYSWSNFPTTTSRFGEAPFQHIDLLKSFPRLGRLVPDRPGVRMLSHTPIQIYYRVLEEDCVIEILELRHSARR
jgi:plasmid stabilization system protein ParE